MSGSQTKLWRFSVLLLPKRRVAFQVSLEEPQIFHVQARHLNLQASKQPTTVPLKVLMKRVVLYVMVLIC